MSQRLPQAFIDEVLARTDVVDVIGELVPLRKAGRNFMARCPFHTEKTPSFSVSRDKQLFYCFGCGAGGSAIKFLMDFSHLNFLDALQQLAARAGLPMPEASATYSAKLAATADLYTILGDAARYFQTQLKHHSSKSSAVDYLRRRGLDGAIAKQFQVGFAPPGWDNLLRALGTTATAVKLLERGGLVVTKEAKGHYDRFRNRIMFPINDYRGRIIGFGGRVLDDSEPKYLNSPETELFHKGRELYGLHFARPAAQTQKKIFIVEGYMDVIALAQHKIPNVVATLGTATTPEHVQSLFKNADELVFCFDGDAAGRRAAWRALEAALSTLYDGRKVGFLFLPTGEDPDSMVRKNGAEFFTDDRNVVPLSEFLFAELKAQAGPANIEGRAQLAQRARPLVDKLPSGIVKQLILKRLGDETGLPEYAGANLESRGLQAPSRKQRPASLLTQPSLVRKAVQLLVQQPQVAVKVSDPDELEAVAVKGIPFLVKLIKLVHDEPQLTSGQLLEKFRDTEEAKILGQLALAELPVSDPDAIATEFAEALSNLKTRYNRQKIGQTIRQEAESRLSK